MTGPLVVQADALGIRLRALRQAHGWTLRQTAPQVGIDFTYLSKIENGHEAPSERLIRTLAGLFMGDVEELLALGGHIPTELSERAANDYAFAVLLRKLATLPDEQLAQVYRIAGVNR